MNPDPTGGMIAGIYYCFAARLGSHNQAVEQTDIPPTRATFKPATPDQRSIRLELPTITLTFKLRLRDLDRHQIHVWRRGWRGSTHISDN